MMKKEDIQRNVVEFQIVDQQVKLLQQQLAILEQQAAELILLMDNLESLRSVKPKAKAYAQVGPGIAVEATLTEPNHVLMSVGANTLVKKTLPDAQVIIRSQVEEIKNVAKSMESEMKKLAAHTQSLRKEIQKASQQQ